MPESAESAQAEICRRDQTKPFLEGAELALIYFMTDKIVFSVSTLPAGQRSSRDPGHHGAHEVVYCLHGEVVIELGEGQGDFIRLNAGDAALIKEGVAHLAYNPGTEPAQMVWAAAPSLGRPLVYET